MTVEEALTIREFAINWITKVVAKRKDYRNRLIEAIDDLIPLDISEYDGWHILAIDTWDKGKYGGMNDNLYELLKYDNVFELSNKANDDITTAIRIAIDLNIEQSGGVIGFNVGDLRKMYDNDIPQFILDKFENDLTKLDNTEPIWL